MLEKIPPEVLGAAMAVAMSILRYLYDAKTNSVKLTRMAIEALICGAMTLTAVSAVNALGLDDNWIVFVGGTIGYVGPVTVRAVVVKYLSENTKFRIEK